MQVTIINIQEEMLNLMGKRETKLTGYLSNDGLNILKTNDLDPIDIVDVDLADGAAFNPNVGNLNDIVDNNALTIDLENGGAFNPNVRNLNNIFEKESLLLWNYI